MQKKCSSYCTVLFISQGSKILLRILQARLFKTCTMRTSRWSSGFWRGRGTRNHWIMEQVWNFQKNIYFCFPDYSKVLAGWIHKCFLRKREYNIALPVFWESCMQVKQQKLEMDIKKWLVQNWGRSNSRLCMPPAYLTHAEYIMWDASWMTNKLECRFSGKIATSDM